MNQQELFRLKLTKPDGRRLTLYANHPVNEKIQATSPNTSREGGQPHLRWHPWREEWVAYATHRQNRTFLPPKEYNPLAPTKSMDFPTELPSGNYDMAVFDNLFASLQLDATASPALSIPTRPADGHCEVVVFTQDPDTSLGRMPLEQIVLLLRVWADRYQEIEALPGIQYVLPFENRGVEVGVTLHHPHGQIYSYPFVPPIPAMMLSAQRKYWEAHKRALLIDQLERERADGRRMIYEGEFASAFIPECARYAYETWIVPHRAVPSLCELNPEELMDLARCLKTVLLKFDGLWQMPFPYLMALYAAPNDGKPHPEWTFHFEFYPPYRSKGRLKFLAGTELAAGLFVNDSVPEEKAVELRNVEVEF